MPQNKYALARYRLIDSLLRRFNYVKSKLIVEDCQKRLGCRISQRTIQMDIEAMRYDPFLGYFAPIEYSMKNKAYFYSDTSYKLQPFGFSKEEIFILENLQNVIKDDMNLEQFKIFKNIIYKVRILVE